MNEYVGGYTDWLRQRKSATGKKARTAEKPVTSSGAPKLRARKLSYKDQRELDELPQRIENLETTIAAIHQTMADPAFYQSPGDHVTSEKNRLAAAEDDLALAYQRWEELDH